MRGVLAATLCALAWGCAAKGAPAADEAPEACAACHLPEFRSARRHEGVKPTTCAACHGRERWHPAKLRHEWPLDGAHAKAGCFDCHTGDPPLFRGLKRACVDCHRDDYDRAKNHKRFATTCEDCHTTEAWKTLQPHRHAAASASPPPSAAPSIAPSASAPAPSAAPSAAPKPRPVPVPRPTPTPTSKPTPTVPKPDVTSRPSPIR